MDVRNGWGCAFLVGLLLLVFLMAFGMVTGGSAHPAAASALTPPSGPATARFAGSSINTTAPEGTVQQIDLSLPGGGYPGCLDAPEEPVLNYNNDNLELTDIAIISTCGWQADETVKVTLMDPLGKFSYSEVKAVPARQKKDVYQADVFFQPGVDALPGKYRFTLQGSGTVKAKITYIRPSKARLYVLPYETPEDPFKPNFKAWTGIESLRLNGFLPNEPVRLLAYQVKGTLNTFYGWQDFTADPRGQLIIETEIPGASGNSEMNYFAYGRETHFVPMERFNAYAASITRRFDMDLYCPGAPSPRLSGSTAVRPASGATTIDIHQQPGFGSRVAAKVSADAQPRIFGYPKCIDRAFWWQVSTSKPPMFGWAAESFLGKPLIEAAR